ncbi:hypothetical protein [Sinorhizobium meliloti]|uniref:hypothetical protein n=1 Tax=Rhizobium meliloti TaxID=382 RepID=UPI0002861A47|nr:hypothetical protein [Sinorhizobium meliloti]ASP83153.1 hypothetical protein CDO27_35760 [Sinorhizobium meliloti]MQV24954.1 hypothetical protein [Sinorhizobium meliloti]MQV37376.1 hypothetical protein [Sinorhizobium meliloti]MQW20131.1 hypothetical protein [Sinorhizobium meliloti]RVE77423.1 hypothetical protein CN240_30305 [Sinorhizobium meliloti]
MTYNIDDFQTRIAWVADTLIPSDPKSGMPSATEAGVPDRLLPRALKERDDLAPSFFRALLRLPETGPKDPMDAIRALGADDFHSIAFLIAGAYFLDEAINRKLRYPGQEALHETPDYDELMETIERVQSRGQVYLDVPDSPGPV